MNFFLVLLALLGATITNYHVSCLSRCCVHYELLRVQRNIGAYCTYTHVHGQDKRMEEIIDDHEATKRRINNSNARERDDVECYVNVPRFWNMLYELLIYETHSFTIIVVYRKKQKRHFIHETRSFEEKSCLLLYAKVQDTAAE